jgi:peptidoglycan/xylan/chitin deacetylase (PgdA/CDA1 family)
MHPVPVLTYHATNVAGNDYASNDHVALAEDLRALDADGWRIVPLAAVVDARLNDAPLPERAVAITFDDGTDFDFIDLPHPGHGLQRSLFNVMRDFVAERGAACQPTLSATAFVIASPSARAQMDRACLAGRGWFNDHWWRPAVASGLLAIGNHSWDHHHPSVAEAVARGGAGSFRGIATREVADEQIPRARRYIDTLARNDGAALFAYPYGERNAWLVDEYLAHGEDVTGARAAFTTEPMHVDDASHRYELPRYVCGAHWRSVADLRHVLAQR